VRLKQVGLTCVIAVTTLNVWTGGPLLAVWVGSRVQGTGPPSMAAVGTVAVVLGAISFVLVKLLSWLDAIYARVTGHQSTVRRHLPWLRSMRGERPEEESRAKTLTPLEVILIVSVVLVVALFEVWFFFYSSSPIDQRTGRD
jgi:hypothetical protein